MASLAPNRYKIGLRKPYPTAIRITDITSSMEKVLFISFSARSRLPSPRAMAHKGVPPVANKLQKAVTRATMGKINPTPVRARLDAPGRWPK